MQEKTTIARPYARAVFELAQADGTLDQWSKMLQVLKLVVTDRGMQAVITNPVLDDQKLTDVLVDICGEHLDEQGQNFVAILVQANRLLVVPQIAELYEKLKAEAEGTAEVKVISAYPLDDKQKETIREVMSKRLGKKIEITTDVDESLIGGAIIRSGDSVIDASLRGSLKQLSHNFAE